MNKLYIILIGTLTVLSATAQVDIDKSINLSNTNPSDAKVSGIKSVSAAQDALSVEAFQKGSFIYAGTSAGGPTTYTAALAPAITAYVPGMAIYFKANVACAAGPVTITINAAGPKTIKKNGNDLAAGDIATNQLVCIVYDGTNFNLSGGSGNSISAEVDGSITNEIQTLSGSGTSDIALSSGGSVTLQGSGGTNVTRSGNTLTIATPIADNSATNEIQTISGAGTNDISLSSSGGTITFQGAGTASVSRSSNTFTITGTGISGTGTTNYVSKFTSSSGIGDSQIQDNGTTVGIGVTPSLGKLHVVGDAYISKILTLGNNVINTGDPKAADIVIGSDAGTRHDASMMFWSAGSASRISSTNETFYLSPWNTTNSNIALAANVGGSSYFRGNVGMGLTGPSYALDITPTFRVATPNRTVTQTGGNTTTSGGFTIVTFTSAGVFSINTPTTVEVLVIGGGGGGGSNGGGGGGAGGVVSTTYNVAGPVTITVGNGGAGAVNSSNRGSNGGSSTFGTLTASGGGGGASREAGGAATAGASGGGGSSNGSNAGGGVNGIGSGFAGGNGFSNGCPSGGGGGGGVGSSGTNAVSNIAGRGGAGGNYANFSAGGGSPAGWFAGGGGGGSTCTPGTTAGAGNNATGNGGGGNGSNTGVGAAGVANTGGGGGGSGPGTGLPGGSGGSGVVIVRYATITSVATSEPSIIATSGGNVGIGTSTPSAMLEVNGSFKTASFSTVTYTNSVTSGGHFAVVATCANGGTIVTGGCYDNGDQIDGSPAGSTALVFSYPNTVSSWRCGSRDISDATTRTLTAYAVCTK